MENVKNFYVLNKEDELVTILSTDPIENDSPVIEGYLEEKLKSYEQLVLSFPDNADTAKIEEDFTIVFNDIRGWREYFVTTVEADGSGGNRIITLDADISAVELADEPILEELRLVSRDPKAVLTEVLKGTRWKVGTVDSSVYAQAFSVDTEFRNVLEVLADYSSNYSCEIGFSYAVSGNRVTDRFVNVYKQIGRENTGKRFEAGKDIESIKRTVDTSNIKTAIVPYGAMPQEATEVEGEEVQETPERYSIKDIVWSIANGDPTDKPAGQSYIEDKGAKELWGRSDGNGGKRNRFITMEMEVDSPEQLAQMAWVQLGRYSAPKVTYEAKVLDLFALTGDQDLQHEQIFLGDTVAVIDDNFAKPIEILTRVVELKRNLTDATDIDIVLGDSKQLFSVSSTEERVEEIKAKADKALYKASYAQLKGGGNYTYEGSDTPVTPAEGDTWFRPHPTVIGEKQMLRYNGTIWTVELDTSRINTVEDQANSNKLEADRAKKRADEAYAKAQSAEAGLLTKVGTDTYNSAIAQLQGDINLRVTKDDVVNQINISDEGILIDGSKLHITAQTYIDGAVIKDANIVGLSADKITAGQIDASFIDVINLNADNITAGSLDLRRLQIVNGAVPVMTVDGATNEVTMTVSKLVIRDKDIAQELDRIGELEDGKSAYEIAVEKGFVGTEAQWLESLKGEQGERGVQGIKGADGKDGSDRYTWIVYADNASGGGISRTPAGKTYIGIAYNKTSATPSLNASDYSFTLIKGDKGDQGIAGQKGADGSDRFTWIVYADDDKGAGLSRSSEDKRYLGIAYNKTTPTPLLVASHYTFSPLFDNVKVGGRNLLRDSGRNIISDAYNLARYDLTETLEEGEELTISLKGNLGAGKSYWGIYNSGGSVAPVSLGLASKENGVYKATFKWRVGTTSNSYINVYHMPAGVVVESEIEWIKLEKGNVATDWTPAPEDVDEEIGKKADNETVNDLTDLVGQIGNEVAGKADIGVLEQLQIEFNERVQQNREDADKLLTDLTTLEGRTALIDQILGEKTARWEFIETVITQGEEGMLIGNETDKTGVLVSDKRISFLSSGTEVAFISGNTMQINHGIFVESATIGKHKIETLPNTDITVFTFVG